MIHADVDLEEAVEAGNATTTVTTYQTADENETFLSIQGIITHLQNRVPRR
jgi:predicted deacylase